MKDKTLVKTKVAKNDKSVNYTNVILEQMEDSIKLVLEGQVGLQRQFSGLETKVDSLGKEMRRGFGEISGRVDGVDSRLDGIDSRLEKVEANQKVTLEYLSRIDDDSQTKLDQKEFAKVDERLCLVEKVLAKRKLVKV